MSHLSGILKQTLEQALSDLGDHTGIRSVSAVGGGCINNVVRIETGRQKYLFKWNADPLPQLFTVEASGLDLIRATDTVRAPLVYAYQEKEQNQPAWILEEWLEPGENWQKGPDMAVLGQQLARMHAAGRAQAYGLDHDNYIGPTPQPNGWETSWLVFFREHRLVQQRDLAGQRGRLPANRARLLDRLIGKLDQLIDERISQPALIHGDLWGGNVIAGPAGAPVLIDPAVNYADREAEIAFTELFGGFSARFYAAYQETWPLDPGYPERRDLYNLYHLLNHLNIFGEGYGSQVDSVLQRYV